MASHIRDVPEEAEGRTESLHRPPNPLPNISRAEHILGHNTLLLRRKRAHCRDRRLQSRSLHHRFVSGSVDGVVRCRPGCVPDRAKLGRTYIRYKIVSSELVKALYSEIHSGSIHHNHTRRSGPMFQLGAWWEMLVHSSLPIFQDESGIPVGPLPVWETAGPRGPAGPLK